MRKGRSQFSRSVKSPLKSRNTWITSEKPRTYDFREILEGVAWIWRVLGVFSITIRGPIGIKRYGISQFLVLYSALLFGICIGNFIYVMTEFNHYFRNTIAHVTTVTILIRITSSLLCMFISNVCRIFQYRELSETINNMSEQDIILQKMSSRVNYDSRTKIIRPFVWTSLAITLLLMAYEAAITILQNQGGIGIQYVLWKICLMAQIIDFTVFVSLVGLLGLKFQALNAKLRTVVTRANVSSPQVIVTSNLCAKTFVLISKAHYNLCALGKRIDRIFDWAVIVNVATAFIVLSVTLYYIFYEVHRDGETSITRIISNIHCEFFHSAPIVIIVVICNWTSRQAVYAGELIHAVRVEKTDSRLYEAVKSFSLQLHHQKLEFTARGFFPLNSTLLQSMVGTITTYLIILIQFEPKVD